ncbi:MAG: urease accessory protein [Hyphomicrobiales bacterium]|nr:urease accessory protein [Hyphomicrobiales bacterium]
MDLISTLLLGVLLGMRHALDADHVAAVASLATRSASSRETVRLGIAWGVGHTLTLFAVSVAVLLLGASFSGPAATMAEFAVGIMLVVLGADVVWRAARQHIHAHPHAHADGSVHLHAHSHAGEQQAHEHSRHRHGHRAGMPARALAVGLMHGLAGSAALLLLTVATVERPALGILYVALFGAGSIFGMGLLSLVVALPLRALARHATPLLGGLHVLVGGGTMILGAWIMVELAA